MSAQALTNTTALKPRHLVQEMPKEHSGDVAWLPRVAHGLQTENFKVSCALLIW